MRTDKKPPKGQEKEHPNSKFDQKIVDKICEELSCSSLGLRDICKGKGITRKTFMIWVREREDVRSQYARAKEEQMDYMAEELISIADDGSNDLMTIVKGDQKYELENKEVTNRSKLRVQARQWVMSKAAPKKYGEKLDLTSDGEKFSLKIGYGEREDNNV